MPLATLFIGGVLPASLGSLIRKRAGYMKEIMNDDFDEWYWPTFDF